MERLAPVIQGTTVELIHQPKDGEGARIIAAAVAARLRRRDRIADRRDEVPETPALGLGRRRVAGSWRGHPRTLAERPAAESRKFQTHS